MRSFRVMQVVRSFAALTAVAALAACTHYSLGSSGKLPFQKLYVAPVQNSSFAAQVQAPVTEMLRQALLQEGNVKLTNQADADATLDVVITNYQRQTSATQQSNSLNAQSYSLALTAMCTLVDNRTGKVYFKDRPVTVTQEAFIQNGDSFNQSEYQTISTMARELGSKIRNTVVSTW